MRWATKQLAFGTDDVDPALLTQTQALLEEPPLRTLASLQGSVLRNDTRPGLDRLKGLRVLVITGSEDKLTRPEHSVRMAEDLGAELLVLPGAGHVLNQTRPTETNAALHRLLDAIGS
jgi:pimeloyl-ACP methyl ester carboxylesterase